MAGIEVPAILLLFPENQISNIRYGRWDFTQTKNGWSINSSHFNIIFQGNRSFFYLKRYTIKLAAKAEAHL
jgi:hypothetical protein